MGLKITITDSEVRYDVLMSADLRKTIVANGDRDFYYYAPQKVYRFVDEQIAAKTRQGYVEFFKQKCAVYIDGVRVLPVLEKLRFVPYIVPGIQEDPLANPPDVELVLSYPTKGRPKQVRMVWELYPQDPTRAVYGLPTAVEVVADLLAFGEDRMVVFSAEEPEYTWHAPATPLKQRIKPVVARFEPRTVPLPLASLAILALGGGGLLVAGRRLRRAERSARWPVVTLAVAALLAAGLARHQYVKRVPLPWQPRVALPDAGQAVELFETLQRNVYRAFDYTTESDIYDVLAQSVAGDLLDQIYTEVYRSLIMRDQGGAVARVQSVDFLDTALVETGVEPGTGSPAFKVKARWRVRGIVRHWGHAHCRTNEYTALFTIAQREQTWKIVGVEDVTQKRIPDAGDDPTLATRPASQPAAPEPPPGRERATPPAP